MKLYRLIYILALMLILCAGCDKFLEEKSDKALNIPALLEDYQALLDNSVVVNGYSVASGEMSADNYYITTASYNSLNLDYARNIYRWAGAKIDGAGNRDWELCYSQIYTATVVLDGINKIRRNGENQTQWDNVKGQALTLRAYRYLDAVTVWGKAYDEATAHEDLGIPLRQTTDFNERSVRVSVQETYNEIIKTLKEAIPLLPMQGIAATRANRRMAYAGLSRVYLFMGKFKEAELYADSALQINDKLLDFNKLVDNSLPYVAQEVNEEMVCYMSMNNIGQLLDQNRHCIDTVLFDSFLDNDLRKRVFFQGNSSGSFFFKGNYTGIFNIMFSGMTNAELYLTRAECYARKGKIIEAMDDLNKVLKSRMDNKKTFIPFAASSKDEAMAIILSERRKELMFRGIRWPDIKRLNKDGANMILTRIIDGKTYTLPPNDNRYALPIPEDVIQLSGMPQNPQ